MRSRAGLIEKVAKRLGSTFSDELVRPDRLWIHLCAERLRIPDCSIDPGGTLSLGFWVKVCGGHVADYRRCPEGCQPIRTGWVGWAPHAGYRERMTHTPFTRPFRFGVQTGTARPDQSWGDFAREVEALGYSTLTCPDHFVDTELAPVVALTAAAEATTRLRVGALVFDNDYKHPAILAKEMATLDLLSSGRVELGLGAGWMRADYDALGLQYDSAGVRIDRMVEGLDVMERCLAGEAFSHNGEHYTIADYTATPKPAQARIPVNIGGGGKRVLSIAAQRADIVGINPNLRKGEVTPDAAQDSLEHMWQQKLDWIRDAAGERFNDLELQIRSFMVSVTDDRMGLAEMMAPAFGVTPEEALASHAVLAGTIDEIVDEIVESRKRYGVSYWLVGEDTFREFAPVVARLAGS